MKSDGIFCSLRVPDSYSPYRCFIARLNSKIIIIIIIIINTWNADNKPSDARFKTKAMKLMEQRLSKDLTVFALECALFRFFFFVCFFFGSS